MICLPPISNREGCALLQPPANEHPYLKSMLNALGGCVECANDDMMNTMMVPSCLMGPMYGIMRNNRDWLGEICDIYSTCTNLKILKFEIRHLSN